MQVLFQAGNNRVFTDVLNGKNAGGTALLGEKCKAVFDGFARVAVAAYLAVELDGPALPGGIAEDVFQGFGTAASVQPCQAQNFSGMCLEADILQKTVLGAQIVDFQGDLAGLVRLRRELVGQLATDHVTDDIRHFKLGRGLGHHVRAVAHDGDIVGNPLDFRHLV